MFAQDGVLAAAAIDDLVPLPPTLLAPPPMVGLACNLLLLLLIYVTLLISISAVSSQFDQFDSVEATGFYKYAATKQGTSTCAWTDMALPVLPVPVWRRRRDERRGAEWCLS